MKLSARNQLKGKIININQGILTTGLMTGTVFAADTEVKGDENLKGEVYAFIAASLSNSMEEIQKDFNELYPNVTIYYSADSSGTLQTQIEEGARCDLFFIFCFSPFPFRSVLFSFEWFCLILPKEKFLVKL